MSSQKVDLQIATVKIKLLENRTSQKQAKLFLPTFIFRLEQI